MWGGEGAPDWESSVVLCDEVFFLFFFSSSFTLRIAFYTAKQLQMAPASDTEQWHVFWAHDAWTELFKKCVVSGEGER